MIWAARFSYVVEPPLFHVADVLIIHLHAQTAHGFRLHLQQSVYNAMDMQADVAVLKKQVGRCMFCLRYRVVQPIMYVASKQIV